MPTEVLKELSKYLFVIQIHHINYRQLSEWKFFYKIRSRLGFGSCIWLRNFGSYWSVYLPRILWKMQVGNFPYCSRFPEHNGNSRCSPISALPWPLLGSELADSIGQEGNYLMTKCGLDSILLKAETQTQIFIRDPSKLVEVNYEDPEEPMAPQQRGTSATKPVSHLCWTTAGPMNPMLASLPILETFPWFYKFLILTNKFTFKTYVWPKSYQIAFSTFQGWAVKHKLSTKNFPSWFCCFLLHDN